MTEKITKKQARFKDVAQRINAGKTCDNCVMLVSDGDILSCTLVKLVMFFHHQAARRKVCDKWEGKRRGQTKQRPA